MGWMDCDDLLWKTAAAVALGLLADGGGDAIFCSPLDDPMYIRCTVKVEEMNIKYIIYW